MANLNTANFTLTGMTAKRSLGARLEDRWVTVKDFGAVGDGSHDDTTNIQAAINYCYGAPGAEHGETNSTLNKGPVFFPRGRYKISAPLQVNNTHNSALIGAGSHQSRIFWAGAAVVGSLSGYYPVIEYRGCWHVHMAGLTLDASGVQNMVMVCIHHPDRFQDGSDGYYRDVHITGAVQVGGLGGCGVVMGGSGVGTPGSFASERTWVKCKFTNCGSGTTTANTNQGYRMVHGNALNHEFYGCHFADCGFGIYAVGQAGSITANGCSFENNELHDVYSGTNATRLTGCRSTSQNFAIVDGIVMGCTHINASAGEFYANWNNPGALSGTYGTGVKTAMLIGNHSTNGLVQSDVASGYPMSVNLMGNRFDNSGYLTGTLGRTSRVWVDGTQVAP
jgi:hypothetical protein